MLPNALEARGARQAMDSGTQFSVLSAVAATSSDRVEIRFRPNRFAPGASVHSVNSVLEEQRSLFDSEVR